MTGFDYTILKEFCKVRNLGDATKNGINPTPRMNFITDLLQSLGIEYYIDTYTQAKITNPACFGLYGDDLEVLKKPLVELENLLKEHYTKLQNISEMLSTRPASLEFDSRFVELEEEYDIARDGFEFYKDIVMVKKKLDGMEQNNFFNIVLPGTSKTMFIAHHDVKNPDIDNCNDNSASIINLIALKMMHPEATIVFTDGEELGGIGADRLAEMLNKAYGFIRWVVNLELTAVGGTNFIVGKKRHNKLYEYIVENFECEPFDDTMARSDASILQEKGIQSCVITTLPKKDGVNDYDIINYCHKPKDTIDLANFKDMQDFVEQVLVKLI